MNMDNMQCNSCGGTYGKRCQRANVKSDKVLMSEMLAENKRLKTDIRKLLDYVDRVTSFHLRERRIPERYLSSLSNVQINIISKLQAIENE